LKKTRIRRKEVSIEMASALFDGSPSRAAVLAALYYGLSSMGAQFMNKVWLFYFLVEQRV